MGAGVERHGDGDGGGDGDELYCPTCEQTFAVGADRCPTDNTRLVRIAGTRDHLIGRDLDGRYTILAQIGAGGMGAVYRGTQHQLGREVAIKVVTPSLVKDPLVIKRFLREAKLASRLSHPNAVSVLDFGQTDDGLFFLVMELVNGRTLEDIIATGGKLSPARVVRVGAQICDALEGAHALHIIHRDLKPQNVMLMATSRDHVKVLDFGLAKSLSPDQGNKTTMTNAGALLGTPAFMPPELALGEDCDARADLYALGCILYVCAAGRLPFISSSVHELIAMHAADTPPRIADIPTPLWAVIARLLAKRPDDRFPTATAARDALEQALSPAAVHAAMPEAAVAHGDDSALPTTSSTVLGWDGASGVHAPPGKGGARVMTPAGGVRVTTPARGVRTTAPAAGVRVPTPGAGVRAATPGAGVRVTTPAAGVRVPTPAAGVRVATPAAGVRVPTPGAGVRVAAPRLSIGASSVSADDAALIAGSATMPSDSLVQAVAVARASMPVATPPMASTTTPPNKLGWKPIALVLAAGLAAAVLAFVLVDSRRGSKATKIEPTKIEQTKIEPTKAEAKVEAKAETKIEPPKVEPKAAAKAETKIEPPKVEPKAAAKVEPPIEPTKVEAKLEPPKRESVETKIGDTQNAPKRPKTVEKRVGKPTDKSTDKRVEKPTEKPADKPTDAMPPRRPVKTNPGVM